MSKKALLAVMMALVLLLSGCTLIQKDEAVDNATEIIRLGDKVITKKEVKDRVSAQLEYNYMMYSQFSYAYDVTDPTVIANTQDSVVEALKKDLALTAKAKELGIELTDEELEEVRTNAQEDYDSIVSSAKGYVEGAEGMDEEALTAAAEKMAEEAGYSVDSYIESGSKTRIESKLRDYAIKDVAVTDEEIQAEYDSNVADDKETYAENPGSWAAAANNGTTLYYTPAGVRRVKQILIGFTDEGKAAITEAQQKVTDATTARSTAQAKIDSAEQTLSELEGDSEEITEARETAQANLEEARKELEEADKALAEASQAVTDARDQAFAALDEEADAILASLDAEGADWQAVMDEKDQSENSVNKEKGYAMAAGMTTFSTEILDAAMALEKVGDHSGKVKDSDSGYYILRYESDEAEGPVALDTVKETISSSLLSTKQNTVYNETVSQWVEEAGIKVDMNALRD